jgi:hypothetical protein
MGISMGQPRAKAHRKTNKIFHWISGLYQDICDKFFWILIYKQLLDEISGFQGDKIVDCGLLDCEILLKCW